MYAILKKVQLLHKLGTWHYLRTSSFPRRSIRARRIDMHIMIKKKARFDHKLLVLLATSTYLSLSSGLQTLMIKVSAGKYSAEPSPKLNAIMSLS